MIKVVCAIIFEEQKVLVTQHGDHPRHPFKWELPGGKMEKGETPEIAILREIKEELEIDISVIEELQTVKYNYGFEEIELIPLICKITNGNINLVEHSNYDWLTFDKLFQLDLCEADKELINKSANKEALLNYSRENLDEGC